jgi:hypothetical protein
MEIQWDYSQSGTTTSDGHDIGLSIIPVSTNKKPFTPWAQYQKVIAGFQEWHQHYLNQGTVGIITGKISGNLECLDVDVKNDPKKTIMTEFSDLIPDELLGKLIIQSTPNNGFHLIYRCPEAVIEKSMKLALHSDRAVIIESRGEAGYFCTSKTNNDLLQGVFNLEIPDIRIPEITEAERDLLLETARSLTRYFPDSTAKPNKAFTYSESAINEFNASYNILDLFARHNWQIVKEDDKKVSLLREGSAAQHSGYYFKATKTFHCFSTSTPFKTEKPYNHFQILKVLEGQDDYKTTLRLLPKLGFELNGKADKVGADSISDYLNNKGVRYDSFIQDLTLNGKIIEELDYNTLFIDLKKHFDKEIPRTRFEETIKSHYIQAVNPVMDFIEANKDRNPTGSFEAWLDCLELRNKTIEKGVVLHFLKKWYVGLIAQALDGEYPNEFFLTLISIEQGLGKTTFLRNYTIPKELQVYRKEHSLSFDDDFKVLMSQALLIVDDEMDSRTYEADKTFKTLLSTKELTTRRKYDRRISTMKRRSSFAGSGNNKNVVRESQNRRIIPLEIQSMHFEKLDKLDLVDLFMEAYYLYDSGFSYSYQRRDKELLESLYADYIQKSDVDLILDEYVMLPETISDMFSITNLDLVSSLSNRFPQFSRRINVPTIGKMMVERGYEATRKGDRRLSCYVISKHSKVLELLDNESQTWQLMVEPFVEQTFNNNND